MATTKQVSSEQRVRHLVLFSLGVYVAALAALTRAFKAYGLEVAPGEKLLQTGMHAWVPDLLPKHVDQAHSAAATAFGITSALAFQVWRWSTHPTKRSVALLVFAVTATAFVNYITKVLGLQPPLRAFALFGRGSGVLMYGPLRYLEWAFTTAFLIRLVACLTPEGPKAQRLLRRTLLCNECVMALGALEQWLCAAAAGGGPSSELQWQVATALFCVACALFVPVMSGQAQLYRLAGETLNTPQDAAGLASLYSTTLVTWTLFPVIRGACLAGLVGSCTQEVAFVAVDLISKMGFPVFSLVGAFTLVGGV